MAASLTKEWRAEGVVVVNLDRYYSANGQSEWLLAEGYTAAEIGEHAGIRDTSEAWAVAPDLIREGLRDVDGGSRLADSGVGGDPTLASPAIGEVMLELKIETAVAQLQEILAGT